MKPYLPIRWQSAPRRAKLLGSLQDRSDSWLSRWAATGIELKVNVEECEGRRAQPGGEVWYRAPGDKPSFAIRAPRNLAAAMAHALTGMEVVYDYHQFAEKVGLRAFRALAEAWLGQELDGQLARCEIIDEAPYSGRFGGMSLDVLLGQMRLLVCLSDEAVERIVPRERRARGALTSRESALAPLTTSFSARINVGELSVWDLHSLKVGEILRTDLPVDAAVTLHDDGGRRAMSGKLAASCDNRAIRINQMGDG